MIGKFVPIEGPPPRLEDYEKHWGFVDWQDKVVLDLGADYGSTAYFFLQKGAKRVIAVEPHVPHERLDMTFYPKLVELSKRVPQIQPVEKFIQKADDFIELFERFTVDVVKIDIEGGEVGLLEVPLSILRRIPEYVIEVHAGSGFPLTVIHSFSLNELIARLRALFASAGFDELEFHKIGGGILHFRRPHAV